MTRSLRAAMVACAVLALSLPVGQPAQGAPISQSAGWLVTVTVQTVPALPNVRFSWDGYESSTDDAGRVSFSGAHNFFSHSLAVADHTISRPMRRYEFVRWAGQRDPEQAFRTTVTGLPMRANYTVTAAFSVQYPVTIGFTDQWGAPVESTRISATTLRSDDGHDVSVDPNGVTWLDGSMPTYRKSVLSSTDVTYSLLNVTVDNVSTVDAGRQRFSPGTTPNVTFTVAFHDLVVSARDFIFGPGAGQAALVTGPDGATRTVPFAGDGTARLSKLPKGQYNVEIRGPGGMVLARRVNLSKDQTVEVTVVGWVDLTLGGLAGVAIAVGLIFAGRSRWRAFLRDRVSGWSWPWQGTVSR